MKRKDGKPKEKKYFKCDKCKDEVSSFAFKRHYEKCDGISKNLRNKKKSFDIHIGDIQKISDDIFLCKICNKEYTKKGIGTHYWRSHTEDGKSFKSKPSYGNLGKKGENQYTKAEKLGHCKPSVSQSTKTKMSNKAKNRKHSLETKEKLSIEAKKRNLGGVRQSKKINYNGILLGSSYELVLAQDLDKNNIKWSIPKRINYIDPFGKSRTYQADFYLDDFDIYLDPKNDFLIEKPNPKLGFKDSEKIHLVQKQNDLKIFILNKDELSWNDVLKKCFRSLTGKITLL